METTTSSFQLSGSKWGDIQTVGSSGGEVSYSFATQNIPGQFRDFDSFITEDAFREEVTESFAAWENNADIRFQLVPDSAGVDIRLAWENIDGSGGVLGQTTVPSFGALSGVIVSFDADEDWFLGGDSPPDKIDFSATVIHEIGHAIGINHSETPQSLMNGTYS
ncbi:matrixin family metalloprotease, partial [Alphaproteobacteria bacterium]|nr:matrixin family metalloprotease [Alphaproteobacteria bacterium]